ncbi:RIP homotypic interaction motif-containing protein [Pseudomonas sp. NY15435]|uniref:RIP homotypic interaction motif-containing protein n=1 Tax=Pseudomonas sp. NY15435 TaxID=3400358 RepID=UPI003A88F1B3
MGNPFARMMKDEVFIVGSDQSKQGPFRTAFANKEISIFDETLDVSEGDKVIRELPNGKEEIYTVTEVSFSSGLKTIGPHYTLKLSKDMAIRSAVPKSTTNHITIQHSNGIQIGDHNTQHLQMVLEEVLQRIEDSGASRAEVEEVKNILTSFLKHPLTVSVVGAALPTALGLLS